MGVLQGDCLSPLTFNLFFTTFIRYISDLKFAKFGLSTSTLNPLHWFQFSEDAAVITSLENENKLLLNHFSRWGSWADMPIRVDKCSSFGISLQPHLCSVCLNLSLTMISFPLSALAVLLNILADHSPFLWMM